MDYLGEFYPEYIKNRADITIVIINVMIKRNREIIIEATASFFPLPSEFLLIWINAIVPSIKPTTGIKKENINASIAIVGIFLTEPFKFLFSAPITILLERFFLYFFKSISYPFLFPSQNMIRINQEILEWFLLLP